MTVDKTFREIRKKSVDLDESFEVLKQQIEKKQKEYQENVREISEKARFTQFEEAEFKKLLEKPFTIIPDRIKKDEWYVVVPKMFRMNLGWLDHSDHAYNVFKINKFVNWLGDVPKEIQEQFHFKPKIPLKVYDGMVLTGKEHQDEALSRYKHFVLRREGQDRLRIKSGYEFKLIAKMIDDGILPFIPRPVDKEDLSGKPVDKFKLRDYQKEAWDRLRETGAIGVYWPWSAGKTFLSLFALEKLKGKKVIIVPTIILKEQWQKRIEEYTTQRVRRHDLQEGWDVELITYHAFDRVRKGDYTLAIFDECHHLPANTFARLATIRTRFRIGLSGSPYREDGRTDLIFALTGFPIGMSWDTMLEEGVIEPPDIRLYILLDRRAKTEKIRDILTTRKKTLIFCDGIAFGEQISKEFEIPFVSGSSTKRLEVIEESETTVVSRVGDEGLSLGDIERIIEVDFLAGSRRQEGQRMGRLFHGKEKGEHIIMMTEKEYEDHSKRLYSIYEKGFKIEIVR